MKHAFLAGALVAMLIAGATGAQAEAKWMLGLKGGIAIADLTGDDIDSDATETRTGFVGGGFAQAGLSPNFGIRLEALYHMKGASGDSAGVDGTVKLDYFEFPVLLVAQIPASETVTLSAFAGPVLGFNTSAELEGSAGGFSASLDIKDYVKSFEFGLAFGLGVSFDVGSAAITFDGRYDMGMQTVDDGIVAALGGPDTELDIKNQGFSFMAGIGFPVGGTQ